MQSTEYSIGLFDFDMFMGPFELLHTRYEFVDVVISRLENYCCIGASIDCLVDLVNIIIYFF